MGGKKSEVNNMTIKKALEKIITKHGATTYAEITWHNENGRSLPRRLDLEYQIRQRDEYEHDNIYHSKAPMPAHYRLSKELDWGDLVTYNIYSADKETGEIKLDAYVSVFVGLEYEEYDWKETFHQTKYSERGIPWWLKKDLN